MRCVPGISILSELVKRADRTGLRRCVNLARVPPINQVFDWKCRQYPSLLQKAARGVRDKALADYADSQKGSVESQAKRADKVRRTSLGAFLCSVRRMLHCLLLQVIKRPKYNNKIIY